MRHTVIVLVSMLLLGIADAPGAAVNSEIKVVIEEPVTDEKYSGITNLRGWAVAPAGMTKYLLTVYIDGEFAFYMPHGGSRGDVGSAYPDYPGSDRSGFSMAFNYKNLSPGEHTIEVIGFDDNGDANSASVTFTAERFSSEYIGDMAEVNLTTAVDISLLDQHTILVEGASLENARWDFTLKWDQASQSFKTEGILPSSSDGSGSTPPPLNEDVYACVTSPDRSYSSNDNVITMRNGLELNNYKGDFWYSSEEHMVFETASGKWFTIEDGEEMYQLDVLAEPTSCFEYNYGKVVGVRNNSSGEKILVLGNGEITVKSSCPMEVDTKLGVYQADLFSPAYLVDLLSARRCEALDVQEY